jgi:dihydroorotate dehydrogenase
MGRAWAVGRRLFFAMEPEAAHRVAQSLLGWPLPWRYIGAVPRDPVLRTELAGIPLANPVGLAAGFDKTCERLGALGALGFGYVVGGTITRLPRVGNPRPRLVRDPAHGALVNAMGLPNPGAEAAAVTLGRARRTSPRLVSIADESLAEVCESFDLLSPHVDGVELNASCPNVAWGRDRDTETHVRDLVTALRTRSAAPLLVKLPPFATETEREVVLALASIACESGADGLTCGNTRPVADTRLAVGRGGLSGRPLWERTAASVADVRGRVGDAVAINACGGIATAADLRECMAAGATTVQIYTSLVYGGPRTIRGLVGGASGR